ncbi:hypothetical protein D3C80_1874590 [compost metagenome]
MTSITALQYLLIKERLAEYLFITAVQNIEQAILAQGQPRPVLATADITNMFIKAQGAAR